MQYKNKDFNPELHDKFKILTVKQPYATALIENSHNYMNVNYAQKPIEIRRNKTNYRGDILICSAKNPELYGLESGVTIGLVELYDIKKTEDLSLEEWEESMIPESNRKLFKNAYAWFFKNPRKVIEYPVNVFLGLSDLVYSKDLIIEYPKQIILDDKFLKTLK